MTPTDDDFDNMHHALGRPDGPHVVPYRNRFVTDADSDRAERFAQLSRYWQLAGTMNMGRDAIYIVTPEGERAVAAWVAEKQRKAGLRLWRVDGGGLTARTVLAKSPSAARASVWRDLSDVWGCSFREFLDLGVRVRLA